jgi:hypothetical protein
VITASELSSHPEIRADGRSLAAAVAGRSPTATVTALGSLLRTCYRLALVKPPPTVVTEPVN